MAPRRLLYPEQVRGLLARRFANQHRLWLAGDGAWPMAISLGVPSEKDAQQHGDGIHDWVSRWQSWHGAGTLEWHARQWRALGSQRLPKRMILADPSEVADWLGEHARWAQALARYQRLTARWPALAQYLPRHFAVMADYGDAEFERLEALLGWLESNPQSNLYPRQLPVPGIDSKWLERRKGLLVGLMAAMQGEVPDGLDLYRCCGLRPLPYLVRLRLLDPNLRACAGGLGDVSAPVAELAKLRLPVRRVFIVENTQTGLAFEDMPGAAVLMGLGYGVDVLGKLPWISGTRCVYWGDIDTHGFAILSRARVYVPQMESALMDECTLIGNKGLWSTEQEQHGACELPRLTDEEQAVFIGLKEQRWGLNVRLEQERIPWAAAWAMLVT
jgi:hypothetical protein